LSREELTCTNQIEFFCGELWHPVVAAYAAARSEACAKRPEKRQRNGLRSNKFQ